MNLTDAKAAWETADSCLLLTEMFVSPVIKEGQQAQAKLSAARQKEARCADQLLLCRALAEVPEAVTYQRLVHLPSGRIQRIDFYSDLTLGPHGRRGRGWHVQRWSFILSKTHWNDPTSPLPEPKVATFRLRKNTALRAIRDATLPISNLLAVENQEGESR